MKKSELKKSSPLAKLFSYWILWHGTDDITNGETPVPADMQMAKVKNKPFSAKVIARTCLFPFKENTFEYYVFMNNEKINRLWAKWLSGYFARNDGITKFVA